MGKCGFHGKTIGKSRENVPLVGKTIGKPSENHNFSWDFIWDFIGK